MFVLNWFFRDLFRSGFCGSTGFGWLYARSSAPNKQTRYFELIWIVLATFIWNKKIKRNLPATFSHHFFRSARLICAPAVVYSSSNACVHRTQKLLCWLSLWILNTYTAYLWCSLSIASVACTSAIAGFLYVCCIFSLQSSALLDTHSHTLTHTYKFFDSHALSEQFILAGFFDAFRLHGMRVHGLVFLLVCFFLCCARCACDRRTHTQRSFFNILSVCIQFFLPFILFIRFFRCPFPFERTTLWALVRLCWCMRLL